MNTPKSSVCVVYLLIAMFGCSSSSNESSQDPYVNIGMEGKKADPCALIESTSRVIPMDTAKVQEKGAELLIEVPRLAIVGEAIILKVSLTNKSKDDAFFDHISDYRDFAIQIQDEEDGKEVPRTKYGNIKLSDNGEGRKKRVKLSPGDHLTHCYNLAHLFDLTVVSTYNVSVNIKLNDGVRDTTPFLVKMPNVKLRVLESGDLELAPFPFRKE